MGFSLTKTIHIGDPPFMEPPISCYVQLVSETKNLIYDGWIPVVSVLIQVAFPGLKNTSLVQKNAQ